MFGLGGMDRANVTLLVLKPRGDGIIHSIDTASKVKAKSGEVEEYKTRKHGRIPRANTSAMTASQLAVLVEPAPGQFVQLDIREAIKKALTLKEGQTVEEGVKLEALSETQKEFFARKVETANRYKRKSKWMEFAPVIAAVLLIIMIAAIGMWWWQPLQGGMVKYSEAQASIAQSQYAMVMIFNKTLGDYGAELRYQNGTMRIIPLKDATGGTGWKT